MVRSSLVLGLAQAEWNALVASTRGKAAEAGPLG
jgi:hypothetical protein